MFDLMNGIGGYFYASDLHFRVSLWTYLNSIRGILLRGLLVCFVFKKFYFIFSLGSSFPALRSLSLRLGLPPERGLMMITMIANAH